ncbi:DsrE family protein [Duganella sp. LX20W]|uniref:DsrE family protein n=1 Tax=Rugamonas brunnea TaxID=2758569 RepID=A0A7W2ETJ6_9BURK|nr:DsrE family protein [Rugamonas brunnea]MBA5638358.1 DsrE family protein [Rugamonas brunnea]
MKKTTSSRRTMLVGSLATAAGALAASATAATPAPAKSTAYKALFQVSDDDPKKWNQTLNNIKNLQQDLGAANVTIEVVIFGPGIGMVKIESEVGNRVQEAIDAKVSVLVCQNTMRGAHLTPEDMQARVAYVPAGVGEIVRRQAEGYAYIRS